jgi:hypothetical protein
MYQRYFNALQQQYTKGQQKKEQLKESAADKKVNVAVTQHDSIFKNIQLPGGISTKATEYKDLAAKGDKWESPVFSIGNASESTNLPKFTDPTRKSHSTAGGSNVRGPSNLDNEGMTSGLTSGQGGQGYSSGQGQGYSSGQLGSGQGQGYSSGQLGSGQGTSQFSNQLDGAFQSQGQGNNLAGGLSSNAAPTSGLASSNTAAPAGSASQGGTFLGRNNPVFHGDV